MERQLTLKYMGIPIKFLITDIDIPDTPYYSEVAETVWNNTFHGVSSPNMFSMVGCSSVETEVAYRDYYNLVGALVGGASRNMNNIYTAPQHHIMTLIQCGRIHWAIIKYLYHPVLVVKIGNVLKMADIVFGEIPPKLLVLVQPQKYTHAMAH